MLFPYTYVPHKMEKMHKFIDYIFKEVWCKAPIGLPFRLDLFDDYVELRGVLSSFGFAQKAPKRGRQFYHDIKEIYQLFSELKAKDVEQLKQWYKGNNEIQKACVNDPTCAVGRYTDIENISVELSNKLAAFFKGLYSKQLLGLAALKKSIGDIDHHYNMFMSENGSGKCPFCGLCDVKGVNHTKREAYDHYLPKGLYPFNSINFKNLAPTCNDCNSSYKLTKDPLKVAGGRRKAFYPYAPDRKQIEVSVNVDTQKIEELAPGDIQLMFGPPEFHEEIETWKDVYGIEERYKAKCCSNGDGKYWLEQIFDEWKEDGRSPEDFLRTLRRQATKAPFADNNFLKRAFLEGCDRAGLFDGQ